jgi:hypothetical protein
MTVFKRIRCAKVQPSDNTNRITVVWVGPDTIVRTYTVNQRILNRYNTAEEAKAALDTFTQNNFGYILNDIWLHRNRDGVTWAMATGQQPSIWPEDQIET